MSLPLDLAAERMVRLGGATDAAAESLEDLEGTWGEAELELPRGVVEGGEAPAKPESEGEAMVCDDVRGVGAEMGVWEGGRGRRKRARDEREHETRTLFGASKSASICWQHVVRRGRAS